MLKCSIKLRGTTESEIFFLIISIFHWMNSPAASVKLWNCQTYSETSLLSLRITAGTVREKRLAIVDHKLPNICNMKDCIVHVLKVLSLLLTNTLPNQIPDIFRGSSCTHVNTIHTIICIAATCINHDLNVFCLYMEAMSCRCMIKNTLNSHVMFCKISAVYKTLYGCWICELAFQDVQWLNTSCCPGDSCLTFICSNCPARDHPLTGQTVTTPHWHGVQPLWTMDVWCLHFFFFFFFAFNVSYFLILSGVVLKGIKNSPAHPFFQFSWGNF